MYTVEFDQTVSKIVTLDDEGVHEDVTLTVCDDETVHLSQYWPELDDEQVILMSFQQLRDIINSLDSEEGAYQEVFS
jgi:hypothetical protein